MGKLPDNRRLCCMQFQHLTYTLERAENYNDSDKAYNVENFMNFYVCKIQAVDRRFPVRSGKYVFSLDESYNPIRIGDVPEIKQQLNNKMITNITFCERGKVLVPFYWLYRGDFRFVEKLATPEHCFLNNDFTFNGGPWVAKRYPKSPIIVLHPRSSFRTKEMFAIAHPRQCYFFPQAYYKKVSVVNLDIGTGKTKVIENDTLDNHFDIKFHIESGTL